MVKICSPFSSSLKKKSQFVNLTLVRFMKWNCFTLVHAPKLFFHFLISSCSEFKYNYVAVLLLSQIFIDIFFELTLVSCQDKPYEVDKCIVQITIA